MKPWMPTSMKETLVNSGFNSWIVYSITRHSEVVVVAAAAVWPDFASVEGGSGEERFVRSRECEQPVPKRLNIAWVDKKKGFVDKLASKILT